MDKPEKTVNGTGAPNSELNDDDDEDYNFMNNLSPITSIPTGQTIDLSGVFNRLSQGLSSSSPSRTREDEEEEEDTETVQPDNDGGIDLQKNVKPESHETQEYWENLISEITEPLIYGLPNNSEAFRGLEPVSNGSDALPIFEKMEQDPASTRDKLGCKCKALKCINRNCTCYKWGLGCSIYCQCEGCQNTFGSKSQHQMSDSIKEVGASRNRGCQCTIYKCMNNLCKCYKLGVGCSIRCICEGCLNTFGRHDDSARGKRGCNPPTINPNSFQSPSRIREEKDTETEQPDNNCNTPPRVEDGGIYGSTPRLEPVSNESDALSITHDGVRRRLDFENLSSTNSNSALEGESSCNKACKCKKSKCLKLYCECFGAGEYCIESSCSCVECYNKPSYEDTVMASRERIESRDPLAFAPRIVAVEVGASKTHNRGCNCKKSNCLNNYCECFQWEVGCSIRCRCETCKNSFGKK